MSDPFAHFDQIRENFRNTKSSSQLSSTSGKFLSKADHVKSIPSSSSDSKITTLQSTRVATKRPIIQRQEPDNVKWFTSSFDEDIEILDEKPPKKRSKGSASRNTAQTNEDVNGKVFELININCSFYLDESMPLVGQNAGLFEPKNVEDLAVNSKKIDEVCVF